MGKLLEFLVQNPVDNVEEEIIVSERLKDYPFKIRAVSGIMFSNYQKQSTKITKGKTVQFESSRFNELLILNHTTEPNFRDAESISQAGVQTPEQFLYKSLLAGEIAELAKKITALSGFDQEMDEAVEEVKNS